MLTSTVICVNSFLTSMNTEFNSSLIYTPREESIIIKDKREHDDLLIISGVKERDIIHSSVLTSIVDSLFPFFSLFFLNSFPASFSPFSKIALWVFESLYFAEFHCQSSSLPKLQWWSAS